MHSVAMCDWNIVFTESTLKALNICVHVQKEIEISAQCKLWAIPHLPIWVYVEEGIWVIENFWEHTCNHFEYIFFQLICFHCFNVKTFFSTFWDIQWLSKKKFCSILWCWCSLLTLFSNGARILQDCLILDSRNSWQLVKILAWNHAFVCCFPSK